MSTASFSRSKDEYLALLKSAHEIAESDELLLPVIKLHQNENFLMFVTPMRQDFSQLFFQRLPRTYSTKDGIQRALKRTKIDEIIQAAKDPRYSAPGSIVATLQQKDRPWVSLSWDGDKRRGYLRINLAEVQKRLTKAPQAADGTLDEATFKIGYLIDAHHRTEGHYDGAKHELEMAGVIYVNLPRKEMARVFAQVNEKQEKPSPTHTLAMKQMAGMLVSNEKLAVEVLQSMNSNDQSILHNRIKTFDGKLPKGMPKPYVNLKKLSDLMKNNVLEEIPGEAPSVKEAVIENYLRAIKKTFPDAWADDTKHVLVKAMGFEITSKLFRRVFDAAQSKFHSDSPTQQQFETVLSSLKELKINLPISDTESKEVLLDWNSTTFGGYSSQKGIDFLASTINKHLKETKSKLLTNSK